MGVLAESRMYISVLLSSILALMGGSLGGWTAPILEKLNSTDDNPLGKPLTADEYSWLASAGSPGFVLGALVFGSVAEKLGRKPLLILSCIPNIIFLVTMALSKSLWLYSAGIIIAHFGFGGTTTLHIMYVCEIADPKVRGRLCAFIGIFVNAGTLLTYSIGPHISFVNYHLCLLILPLAFMILFPIFALESPYYVLQKDSAKAEKILKQLRGKYDVCHELSEMQKGLTQTSRSSVLDVFRSRGTRRALVIAIGFATLGSLSGQSVIGTYIEEIFDEAGGSWSDETELVVYGSMQLILSFFSYAITDKFGRKPLLVASKAVAALFLAMLGFYFIAKDNGTNLSSFGWLPLFSLTGLCFASSLGGPSGMSLLGEIFPQKVKNAAVALCTIYGVSISFLTNLFFGKIQNAIGMGTTLLIAACFSIVTIAFVVTVVVETKGKSLEQVHDDLNGIKKENNNSDEKI